MELTDTVGKSFVYKGQTFTLIENIKFCENRYSWGELYVDAEAQVIKNGCPDDDLIYTANWYFCGDEFESFEAICDNPVGTDLTMGLEGIIILGDDLIDEVR